tara:strand:+ start:25 stop:357 length:333 start_codon:yes stop_codon:yes gene_type:complete
MKMSDVFNLPLQVHGDVYGHKSVIDSLGECCSDGLYDDFEDAACVAINTHDSNIERIKELEEALSQFIPANDYEVEDEDGEIVVENHGGEFIYNEDSEHIGLEVIRVLGK